MEIKFEILQRTGFVSWNGSESGVIYRKVREYDGAKPGNVTRHLKDNRGSANDYLIDVIVDGGRIQSHSAAEWLNCEWDNRWNKIRSGKIKLEDRQYQ
ncbi:MAG: hypothetical protein OXI40_11255 [Chloroflexota bacterium]|nr:hypothetical protein [Chloroflexota bacterium]